jgi:hypothetical protein
MVKRKVKVLKDNLGKNGIKLRFLMILTGLIVTNLVNLRRLIYFSEG